MKRILIGLDGSDGAESALRWGASLAARNDAEIVVMTGFVPTDAELPPGRYEVLLAEQEQRLESWSQAIRSGDVEVRGVVEPGDPRPGILTVAEREGADLIVVGRVGRSVGPGLFHIGSTAEWLAHHADLPVAIIGGVVDSQIRTVLVGVDGSTGSRAAVRWIRDALAGADLRIVAAAARWPAPARPPGDSEENRRSSLARQVREDFATDLVVAGVDVHASVLFGSDAADLLLRAAQDERADLIVVGARGLGGFTGLRVGGVALRVLHEADRPVVLVPCPRER